MPGSKEGGDHRDKHAEEFFKRATVAAPAHPPPLPRPLSFFVFLFTESRLLAPELSGEIVDGDEPDKRFFFFVFLAVTAVLFSLG